ncbi:MAG: EVE domain-containing protein [Deltaproteobacteria bacterium]|nr:EVE domain-containing protein [Deltaproteobacteria bacterium]MDQ3299061.1 EVE domain-containing protein [Myxococcota bacterium]
MGKQFWLMKSEPDQFGIADLERVGVEPWSGVRNYMARANMRAMQVGDEVLFHHSSVDPPGVAGLARVVRTGVIDETQFDPRSPYFAEKATREKPIWDCVDVTYVETFPYFVSLERMRADSSLANMVVLKRGMRLSVQPATAAEYARIVALGHEPPPEPPPEPIKRAKPKPSKPTRKPAAKAKRTEAKPVPKPKSSKPAKPRRKRSPR